MLVAFSFLFLLRQGRIVVWAELDGDEFEDSSFDDLPEAFCDDGVDVLEDVPDDVPEVLLDDGVDVLEALCDDDDDGDDVLEPLCDDDDDGDDVLEPLWDEVDSVALLVFALSLPFGCTAMNAFEVGCSLRLAAIDNDALEVGSLAGADRDDIAAALDDGETAAALIDEEVAAALEDGEVAAALDEEPELVAPVALELDLCGLDLWLFVPVALELDLALWLFVPVALELDWCLGLFASVVLELDWCLCPAAFVVVALDDSCCLDFACGSAALLAALACSCDAPCTLVAFDGTEVADALAWCFEPFFAFE